MPVVLRIGSCAFGFYASDRDEPAHVHVRWHGKKAKYWLDPVAVSNAGRFRPHELNQIEEMIRANRDRLLDDWHGFFDR